MKHTDIAIMTNGGGSLGQYSVDPTRYSGFRSDWPKSSKFFRLVRRWLDLHRQRRELKLLDDHMLEDIGLSRHDAMRESEKPFWQS